MDSMHFPSGKHAFCWCWVMTAMACSQSGGPVDAGSGGGEFIAVTRDFQRFTDWEAFPMGQGPLDGGVHTLGVRTAYLNHRPPHASSEFPLGTIIVKQTNEQAPPNRRQVFAMVKRGANFNTSGARNWEWFELTVNDGGAAFINWRGEGPPPGETYGTADQSCNTCHAGARSNDYVQAQQMLLTNF